MGSATGLSMSVVGTLWSAVAMVRSGRWTPRPAMRRPSKAWGEVTSWTRWRSMKRTSGSSSVPAWTTWRSQTFSDRVRGRTAHRTSAPDFDDLDLERRRRAPRTRPCRPRPARSRAWPSGEPGRDHGQVLVGAPRWSRRRSRSCRPRRHPRSGGSRPPGATASPSPPASTTVAVLSRRWSWRIRDSIFPWASLAAW